MQFLNLKYYLIKLSVPKKKTSALTIKEILIVFDDLMEQLFLSVKYEIDLLIALIYLTKAPVKSLNQNNFVTCFTTTLGCIRNK